MGCVTSKKDINDIHPHIFQVENVDELGNTLSSGRLEVKETELVLYQRNKPPVRWPLKSLRRYGYDKEYFSFEAGRRCPTGSGIYGFNCQRAEKLFNFVQAYVQVGSQDRECGTPLLQVEAFYLEPRSDSTISSSRNDSSSRVPRRLSLRNSSRLSSVGSSNGCTSPSTPNCITDDPFMHPLSEEPEGVGKQAAVTGCTPCYENVDIVDARMYMNVDISRTSLDMSCWQPGNGTVDPARQAFVRRMSCDSTALRQSPQHCYANLHIGEMPESVESPPPLVPYLREVNYAELDLDKSNSDLPPTSPTETVSGSREGYVTIDFDRTVALSQSASSSLAEGVRKTRHDTADPAPSSSRQSTCLSD